MIRLVRKVSPPKGGALRSGNTKPFVGQSEVAHCRPCPTKYESAWFRWDRC
jgi:hypothetical protein